MNIIVTIEMYDASFLSMTATSYVWDVNGICDDDAVGFIEGVIKPMG